MGLFFSLLSSNLCAKINSGLCNPYYASIKNNRANAYIGPGKNYKIVCEYTQKGLPLLVTAKYDHWRKVKDPDGTESWVHKSQLTSKRFVITKNNNPCEFMKNSNESSDLIGYIKKNVIMSLLLVRGNWCQVEIPYIGKKYKGWIKKENLFGVLENETW